MNPYLAAQRQKYDALRESIEGLQQRAVDEDRDLTEDELRSVNDQAEAAKALAATIQNLTEIEQRNLQVADFGAKLIQAASDAGHQGANEQGKTRPVGHAQTKDRDPGHYRSDGGHSFFGDLFHARTLQDADALKRLTEHNRALDMAGEGPGVIPPVWMSQEFAEMARQQRKVANAVRNIPLANAAPLSMPKQTGGTDDNVLDQTSNGGSEGSHPSSSGTNLWDVDSYDTAVDTVSPTAIAGAQLVSRQMLDSSNPAIDALIFGDLTSAYNLKIEAKVVAAMVTAASTAVATYATEAAWTAGLDAAAESPAVYVIDAITDAAIAVRTARKLPADILIASVARYASLLKIKDASGRPLVPAASAGLSNVVGRGNVAVDGFLDTANLSILATDGVPATYPESVVAARALDTILFESPMLRFRYEEPNGPEVIRLGIWAYAATYVKYAGSSTKRIVITAAS